ncbi:MAG TPA: DUF6629 family protein [Bacteroidales bacterium]|nr:DUF6629 family protein [Bacteroidales bacterium]
MCFSASASFTSGVVISTVGAVVATKTKTPNERLFSLIPLFFGFQQFAEGFVWLSLQNAEYASFRMPATYYFLFMADVVWPIMVPISLLRMESSESRKRYLKLFSAAGLVLGTYYLTNIITRHITPVTNGFHIDYSNDFPDKLVMPAFLLYLVVTIAPIFISGVKRMFVFGIVIFIAVAVSGFFYTQYLSSVWCFFAAAASVIIYWILTPTWKGAEEHVSLAG